MVVNIAGMSLKKQASRGGQHHRNRWSRWIRIGGQDGSEYTLCRKKLKKLQNNFSVQPKREMKK